MHFADSEGKNALSKSQFGEFWRWVVGKLPIANAAAFNGGMLGALAALLLLCAFDAWRCMPMTPSAGGAPLLLHCCASRCGQQDACIRILKVPWNVQG